MLKKKTFWIEISHIALNFREKLREIYYDTATATLRSARIRTEESGKGFPSAHSLDAKGIGLLNGQQKLLMEDLRSGIGRQVESIEASVRSGQCIGFSPLLHAEASRSRWAPQRREAIIGNTRGARDKLQQSQSLFIGKLLNHLLQTKNYCIIKLKIKSEI